MENGHLTGRPHDEPMSKPRLISIADGTSYDVMYIKSISGKLLLSGSLCNPIRKKDLINIALMNEKFMRMVSAFSAFMVLSTGASPRAGFESIMLKEKNVSYQYMLNHKCFQSRPNTNMFCFDGLFCLCFSCLVF